MQKNAKKTAHDLARVRNAASARTTQRNNLGLTTNYRYEKQPYIT